MKRTVISVFLALCMLLSVVPTMVANVIAADGDTGVSGDFEYSVISEEEKTCEITKYNGSATELTIPSQLDGYTATEIGDSTFEYCNSLTSVIIPNSVTSIGHFTFSGCTSLTSITIPDIVTDIGAFAFDNTAYYNNESNWENGVLYIGKHLIKAKTDISSEYSIKDGTKTIAEEAFISCNLITSIEIPESVNDIGINAFIRCELLKSIFVNPNNADYCDIDGVLFNKGGKELLCYPSGKSNSYEIPNGVVSIGYGAFMSCYSLISVEIPNSVKNIGYLAFFQCASLKNIEIPKSVASICMGAFGYCLALENIIIPNGVKQIGDLNFIGCESLTSITIPNSVTSIGESAFSGCNNLTFYGYSGSYAEDYANKESIPFVAIDALKNEENNIAVIFSGQDMRESEISLNVNKLSEVENTITYT